MSSLQTGVFAGPVGSQVGQLRFHPDVVVRTPQVNRALLAVQHALIEARMRALDDPRAMVSLWMIGLEDTPEHSSEINVAEIFGRTVQPDRARIGMGVHPFGDPAIVDDFVAEERRTCLPLQREHRSETARLTHHDPSDRRFRRLSLFDG